MYYRLESRRELMAIFDIFVIPSVWEGFGDSSARSKDLGKLSKVLESEDP